MDISKGKQEILNYIKLLKDIGLFTNKLGCISLRIDEDNILISPCIESKHFTIDDIKLISSSNTSKTIDIEELDTHRQIYKSRKDVNSIIRIFSDGVMKTCSNYETIPPVLDDMAQIIGPSINVSDKLATSVVKLLKGRAGVLLKDQGGLCTGRSLHEAFVACQVFEKSCVVFHEAKKIGGVKPLSKPIAYAMHQVYLRVYSKRRME